MAIALAFGLTIVAGAYAIGHISGCHVNPAVSLGVFMAGRMDAKDFGGYVIAQIIGAFAGTGLLQFIVSSSNTLKGLGANGYGTASAVGLNMGGRIRSRNILNFRICTCDLGGNL